MIQKHGKVIIAEDGIVITGFEYKGDTISLRSEAEIDTIRWAIKKLQDAEKDIKEKIVGGSYGAR